MIIKYRLQLIDFMKFIDYVFRSNGGGVTAEAGVPVPEVRCVLAPEDGLGSGYVMTRLEGETIPLLRDVIALVKGRMRLNIELKEHGHERAFPESVVDLIRRSDIALYQAKQDGRNQVIEYRADMDDTAPADHD